MASKTELCNQALAAVGGSIINDVDTDTTRDAILCRTFYDSIAQATMFEGAWISTITRKTLAAIAEDPEYEFGFQFQLPVNPIALRVLSINEEAPGQYYHKIEGDRLLINISEVKIKYIAFITEPGKYDIGLQRTIVAHMASILAWPLTGSNSFTDRMDKKYDKILASNLALNGMIGGNEVIRSDDLIQVR